jgi:hypothetical protein
MIGAIILTMDEKDENYISVKDSLTDKNRFYSININ